MSDDFLETNWHVALKTEYIDRSSSQAQQDLPCWNTLLIPMKKIEARLTRLPSFQATDLYPMLNSM